LPWRRAGANFGFSAQGGSPAWLTQPSTWSGLSVEAQAGDAASLLSRVRAAIAIRRGSQALLRGSFAWDETLCRDGIVAFRRSVAGEPTVLCVANMGTAPSPSVNGELLAASGEVGDGSAHDGSAHNGIVPPDTTAWFRLGPDVAASEHHS